MQKPPPAADPDDRVIPLRKRGADGGHGAGGATTRNSGQGLPQIGDLDRYPPTTEADDDRHRMMTNIAGVAIALVLIVVGIWIANTMASMRKNQECVLSGRRGCTPVEAPLPQRW